MGTAAGTAARPAAAVRTRHQRPVAADGYTLQLRAKRRGPGTPFAQVATRRALQRSIASTGVGSIP